MRNAEFDREYVLSSAMNEFIAKGYNKTSMQDLKRATGLHPGSIYCAFENKRGLLLAALDRYATTKSQSFEQFFDDPKHILSCFERYLHDIIEFSSCDNSKGCLLQNALSELNHQDDEVEQIICNMLKQWKHNIQSKLELARANNEIGPEADCELLSDYLVMNIYGLRSFANTKPSDARLAQLVDKIMQSLKSGGIYK
ncbi:TetR/AcrR family transcriptional regulator [Vibrio sp. B1FLJ16]|uniref:TetR/AcrR family transcriptional regulator n=1 Tax=Vibrio sp. B1FLJ16 TaxID=2751178 RepID=UPI0015F52898|nr:TetR/AcrR family transcriptional regulator [Vibrio sp. B1FLJ16]CAD7818752.1 Bacterial transcriptional repressor C-terminal [Vibrio sp. B1FLJ16]CAE6936024.1 Bacterial transcriptional repressor C-terminal [Vibrio sp. B1FLJ16]